MNGGGGWWHIKKCDGWCARILFPSFLFFFGGPLSFIGCDFWVVSRCVFSFDFGLGFGGFPFLMGRCVRFVFPGFHLWGSLRELFPDRCFLALPPILEFN